VVEPAISAASAQGLPEWAIFDELQHSFVSITARSCVSVGLVAIDGPSQMETNMLEAFGNVTLGAPLLSLLATELQTFWI
jgi:hypothetical protein